jgi:hypothetical protein
METHGGVVFSLLRDGRSGQTGKEQPQGGRLPESVTPRSGLAFAKSLETIAFRKWPMSLAGVHGCGASLDRPAPPKVDPAGLKPLKSRILFRSAACFSKELERSFPFFAPRPFELPQK